MHLAIYLVNVWVLEDEVDDGEEEAVGGEEGHEAPVGPPGRLPELVDAVADDRRAVDHRHLVHQLRLVLERRVEQHGAEADHHQGGVGGDQPEMDQY